MEEDKRKWWTKLWTKWWTKWWGKLIIIIIILISALFPIIINALTLIPNGRILNLIYGYLKPLFDDPTKWTEVWAEYGGALLSAGIALVILYKQQKQNEKQNEFNRILQINALKYQQKYNWFSELKHVSSDLMVACDANIISDIKDNIRYYYELTDKNEIDEAKSEIEKSINDRFHKINFCFSSFYILFNEEEYEELEDKFKILDKNIYSHLNILSNLRKLIVYIANPVLKKISEEKIKELLDSIIKEEENHFENLNECVRIGQKTILKEYLEKYNYDFYGNASAILDSMFEDFENNVETMYLVIPYILQFERDKIDKLLDVEEIKKNLNAN